ncbi:MAG: molybdopterin-guanine dinucleotide biosynthesis protein B [Rhodospirillaceae bacterium]|jgi:molybdopterin-guanine dinucleotide biosynthesis protein B|nr:molybdopterin-guanine dinucleotide biosynthesis protein B [Rhodospirillales bacterium]MBT3906222.1 molybdopterin-guanine dinucleotide biosynthesis protein B [Rhodospirillaceae bacterium]MBT4700052.1 molybdopterin-guanine dinucleotide biosynthesis protein B [Rhodospirillaceae bacterium]MBT5034702.1 molybdopterin-guanine dinucleotide biosynthesis protein B [Rhodospirillaceae bacterium]MBT6221497.1 molybdopterin-guanine dinucleotide biosynthesis protein B [Rhodospirillaceae bacterium]
MQVFGLIGWQDSGKTTLMVKLIPEIINRGHTVSSMKHTHHSFDIDKPGKDSFEHRRAGAGEVLVASGKRWALMHELDNQEEPTMDELVGMMAPVDLLLVEGFKRDQHAKMEVHRSKTNKPLLCENDPTVVAVASDKALPHLNIPVLDINDVAAIADFVLGHCELEA